LTILENYKKSKVPIKAFSEDLKQSYNIEDFKQLGIKKNQFYKELSSLNLQYDLEKKTLELDENKYNTLFEKYEKLKAGSLNKMLSGLTIIKTQISLAIDEIQIERSQSKFDQKKQQISFLKKEIVFAREHLIYHQEDLNKIINEKNSLIKKMHDSQNIIEESNNEINILDYQDNIDNLEYHRLLQILLKEIVNEAQINTKLIINEIQGMFLKLGLKKENIKTEKLFKKVSSFTDSYMLIKNDKKNWKKQADLRFEKSLQYILKAKQSNLQLNQIELIAQETLFDLITLDEYLDLTSFFIDQFTIEVQENYATFSDSLYNWWSSIVIFYKTHASWFEDTLFKIGKKPITPLGIIKFFVILIATYIISRLIKRYINKIGKKQKKISSYAIYTLSRLSFYIAMIFGVIIAIVSLGVDFTAFAFIAGALGVGIGFGLQVFFNNFISGIILLLEKNIRVGDFIQLESGEYGSIKEINVRTTLMKTLDNLEILIPNSDLALKKFTNWTLSEKIRRVRIPFTVAYGTDKDIVKKVIIQAAKTVSITIKDKPIDVWLVEFAESSLNFELVVWVNEYITSVSVIATKARYLWIIETALKENNITIPFPQRDVHVYENKKD
jgi:potassium-dependent mechanosensitive channel